MQVLQCSPTTVVSVLKSKCELLQNEKMEVNVTPPVLEKERSLQGEGPKLQASSFMILQGLFTLRENQALCIFKKKVLKFTIKYFYIYMCMQSLLFALDVIFAGVTQFSIFSGFLIAV